jgi:hypothetical protein
MYVLAQLERPEICANLMCALERTAVIAQYVVDMEIVLLLTPVHVHLAIEGHNVRSLTVGEEILLILLYATDKVPVLLQILVRVTLHTLVLTVRYQYALD